MVVLTSMAFILVLFSVTWFDVLKQKRAAQLAAQACTE